MKKNEYWTVKFLKSEGGCGFKKGDIHIELHKSRSEICAYFEHEISNGECIPVKVRIEEVKK